MVGFFRYLKHLIPPGTGKSSSEVNYIWMNTKITNDYYLITMCSGQSSSQLPEEYCSMNQGGITCEAIVEPRKSSKAIDKRVIINFRDENVEIARFRDINEVFI